MSTNTLGALSIAGYPFVSTAGNVGIGVTGPQAKLHVDGNIIIRGASGGNSWTDQRLLFGGDGSGYKLSIGSINNLATINTAAVTIQDNGYVGIGTTSPTTELTVKSSGYGGLFMERRSDAAQVSGALWFDTSTSGNPYIRAETGYLQIYTGATYNVSAGTERVRILANGNVGIGTTSPETELHVKGTGQWVQPIIDSTMSSAGGSSVVLRGDQNSWALSSRSSANGTTNNGFSIFETLSADIRFVIQTGGNVGIGTTSPAQRLEVKYDAAYILVNSSNGAYSGGYYISSNSVEKWHITNEPGAAHGLYIRDAANDTGVALGQDSTAWVTASDVRLKDVQGPIINALDIVSQLTGVKFTWKRDAEKPNAKTRVGLLAQDVQAAFPEAVDDDHPDIVTDAETGKLSGGIGVRYTELVPLLVNAIKELTTRIATLEQRV